MRQKLCHEMICDDQKTSKQRQLVCKARLQNKEKQRKNGMLLLGHQHFTIIGLTCKVSNRPIGRIL